jgi:hypothetical protein
LPARQLPDSESGWARGRRRPPLWRRVGASPCRRCAGPRARAWALQLRRGALELAMSFVSCAAQAVIDVLPLEGALRCRLACLAWRRAIDQRGVHLELGFPFKSEYVRSAARSGLHVRQVRRRGAGVRGAIAAQVRVVHAHETHAAWSHAAHGGAQPATTPHKAPPAHLHDRGGRWWSTAWRRTRRASPSLSPCGPPTSPRSPPCGRCGAAFEGGG